MKTINLTDKEYEVLVQAVEVINDMSTDTLLDDVGALWPVGEIRLTGARAQKVRDEIYQATDRLIAVRTLMTKLGLETNDKGYSV